MGQLLHRWSGLPCISKSRPVSCMNSGGLSSTHHVVVSEGVPRCLALCLEQGVEKEKFCSGKPQE